DCAKSVEASISEFLLASKSDSQAPRHPKVRAISFALSSNPFIGSLSFLVSCRGVEGACAMPSPANDNPLGLRQLGRSKPRSRDDNLSLTEVPRDNVSRTDAGVRRVRLLVFTRNGYLVGF